MAVLNKAFNPVKEALRLKKSLKSFFAESGCKGIVLGFSGGIDSALCLKVLAESIGKEKVTALLLPEKKNKTTTESENYCNNLGVKFFEIEIKELAELFRNSVEWNPSNLAEANLKARIRMLLLYNYTNSFNYLVCGTGNKSELSLGYFTKYGDGAADFLLIGSLYKTQVIELAKHLNVSREFIERVPSADLWEGQTDEKEFGASYEILDKILIELNEKKKSFPELRKQKKFPEELLESLEKRINSTKHKRKMPEIL